MSLTLISRLDTPKERISELEDWSVETSKNLNAKRNECGKKKKRVEHQRTWDSFKSVFIYTRIEIGGKGAGHNFRRIT